ncbi:MAG TPA: DNA replication and repair protein RecF [Candidatus Saccharimonadales bacterium]|nr:DNA replication and repair protein RecF [Candidatus Saccharimonadales bacterium]
MIQKISVQNFRNLPDKVFSFSPKVTIIVGPNASGKTNLLESIFLLSTGKSFKAGLNEELINEKKEFGRVKGLIEENKKLEVLLTRNAYKKLMINGIGKRQVDFAGNLKTVLFAPQDLDLVTSSPSLRRKFLDNVLSIVDKNYHRCILSYEKGLRSRNKLLFRIREENVPRSQLLFWDQLLIKYADYISDLREKLINFINSNKSESSNSFSLIYDKSAISDERLQKYANAEIAAGTTLVGPHRDDFIFKINTHDLSVFGSRGEQRMAVLWLKLSELSFIEKETKNKPTLLLDDIFSELDVKHRKIIFNVSKDQQTIITTADEDFVKDFTGEIERINFS